MLLADTARCRFPQLNTLLVLQGSFLPAFENRELSKMRPGNILVSFHVCVRANYLLWETDWERWVQLFSCAWYNHQWWCIVTKYSQLVLCLSTTNYSFDLFMLWVFPFFPSLHLNMVHYITTFQKEILYLLLHDMYFTAVVTLLIMTLHKTAKIQLHC